MYYGIILYVEKIKKTAKGYIEIVNYADDNVLCFQYKSEAEQTYKILQARLKQIGLEFAEEKTRLIEFGRFAEQNSKRKGKGKPETFDFLGFTHYCSKSNRKGFFRVKRKTTKKKMKQKIKEFKIWIKENRNKPLNEIMETVKKKLIGHYNYYGITDNSESMRMYYYQTRKILFKWLNRRSQKKSYNYERYNKMWDFFQIPFPKIKVNIYAI